MIYAWWFLDRCSAIIKRAHEKEHFAVVKTEAILNKEYWIPELRRKIEKIICNCRLYHGRAERRKAGKLP